jgi:hypothetical protein
MTDKPITLPADVARCDGVLRNAGGPEFCSIRKECRRYMAALPTEFLQRVVWLVPQSHIEIPEGCESFMEIASDD